VWIWQHGKRTDDYKIILNCVRKLMKSKLKRGWEGPTFLKAGANLILWASTTAIGTLTI
jgi:hypothetical protein